MTTAQQTRDDAAQLDVGGRTRGEPGARYESMSGLKVPCTKSGRATVISMTDAEALALVPGDCVFIFWHRGLAIMTITAVRMAQAGEQDAPYDVPVVEGCPPRIAEPLTFAPADLYRMEFDADPAPGAVDEGAPAIAG